LNHFTVPFDINCLQSKHASSGGMTEAIKSRDGDVLGQAVALSKSKPRRVRWRLYALLPQERQDRRRGSRRLMDKPNGLEIPEILGHFVTPFTTLMEEMASANALASPGYQVRPLGRLRATKCGPISTWI